MKRPIDNQPEAICVGQKHKFNLDVDIKEIHQFANVSGDWNPLHTDVVYAKSKGYEGGVAHGAWQVGLVSQSLGMWLIGKRCLIGGINIRFHRPLIYPSSIFVESEMLSWSKSDCIGRTLTRITDTSGVLFSEAHSDVAFHGNRNRIEANSVHAFETSTDSNSRSPTKELILLTGATGGIIRPMLNALSKEYDLAIISRNLKNIESIRSQLSEDCKLWAIQADLIDCEKREEKILSSLPESRKIYAIIHAASPLPNRESLLMWDRKQFHEEIELAGFLSIEFGRLLKARKTDKGGRLILIGSNFSVDHRPENHLLEYGIVKSFLSTTAKALAHDLAKDGITVNVVSPDFLEVGMNKNVPSRIIRMKAAENPTKTLCNPSDVFGAIQFLLSEKSRFLSGQEIVLNGGKL